MIKRYLISSGFLFVLPIWSLPVSPIVIEGAARFSSSSNQLEVVCKDQSVIDWNSFSISQDEKVSFQLPDSESITLNRVVGTEASLLMGALQSNGKIVLLNPNGVFVGKGGQINTASFIASTFDVHLDAYRGNKELIFKSGTSLCSIVHEGKIICHAGDLFLLANQVENRGSLETLNGTVGCIAGARFSLQGISLPEVTDAPSNLVVNGTITSYFGGDAILLGKEISLLDGAKIDVSGPNGGGNIWIGGGYKGSDARFSNAEITSIAKGVEILADCLDFGDGGRVIVWGNEANLFAGRIFSRGGPLGGNGGFTEVSCPKALSYTGLADLTASKGNYGLLLLDPTNITISSAPTDLGVVIANPSTIPAAPPAFSPVNINNMDLQNQLTLSSVLISTANSGTDAGDITLLPGGSFLWAAPTSLTLEANRNISIQDSFGSGMSFAGDQIVLRADVNNTGVGTLTLTTAFVPGAMFISTVDGGIRFEGADIVIQSDPRQLNIFALGANGNFLAAATNDFSVATGGVFANGNTQIRVNLDVDIYAGRDILLQTNGGGTSHLDLQTSIGSETLVAGRNLSLLGCVAPVIIGPNSYILLNSAGDIDLIAGQDVIADGNEVIDPSGSSGQLAIMISNANDASTTRVYALGNISLDSGPHFDNGVFFTSSFIFGQTATYGNVDLRAGGDILLCTSIDRVGNLYGNPNTNPNNFISIQADHLFAPGEAWSAIPFAPLAGTPLAVASGGISTVTGQVGGGLLGAFGVQNAFFMEGTNTPSGIYLHTIDGDITIKTADRFTTGATADFVIGDLLSIIGGVRPVDLQSSTGDIIVDPFHDVTVANVTATAGNVFEIAQNTIHFTSTGGINAGGNVILVCDNQAPNRPLIGPGRFLMDGGSFINSGGLLQIYTARQGQNTIQGLLNGNPFVPGALFTNTALEIWCTYYPTFLPGTPFTISYKDCFQLLVQQAAIIADELLVDLHPYNEFPGWMERFYMTFESMEGIDEVHYLRRRNINTINNPKSYTQICTPDR